MTPWLTETQLFALIGLVLLVGVLVMGEMFERAIQRDFEEHDEYRPNEGEESNGD